MVSRLMDKMDPNEKVNVTTKRVTRYNKKAAVMVTRHYWSAHMRDGTFFSAGHPRGFATREEAGDNACLGLNVSTVDGIKPKRS